MAVTSDDLRRLSAPFPADDIEWKPGATTRDRKKGLAMAYLTSRAIQDRLDEVCGPGNWRNEFASGPEGGVLCGISILAERPGATPAAEWVTKWDGAENTEFESVKGGLSSALKRAAVQWGIGRYLYSMPALWVRLDERGRFAETPRLPAKFLPAAERSGSRSSGARQGALAAPPSETDASSAPPQARVSPPHAGRPQGGRPQGGGFSQGDGAPVQPRRSSKRVIRKAGS